MRYRIALLLVLSALPAAAGGFPVIEGVAVHAEDGSPVANVQVSLYRIEARRPTDREPIAKTKTDAQGRFELFGAPHQANYSLWVGPRGIHVRNVAPGQKLTLRATLSFNAICGINQWQEMPNAAQPHIWPPQRTWLTPVICD